MNEWQLYAGGKFTGIVVRPDDKWPTMWRTHMTGRPRSDMVNLTRAKDAACIWAKLSDRHLAPEWRVRSRPQHEPRTTQTPSRLPDQPPERKTARTEGHQYGNEHSIGGGRPPNGPKGLPVDRPAPSSHMAGITGPAPA